MRFFLVIAVSVLISTGLRASKVTVSLYALELGASPAMVGLFAALYAIFPLALALHAGRMTDSRGVFRPIMLGTTIMVAGAALPILCTNLWALAICASLIGLGHIYGHVAVHAFVGSSATGNDRTKHFGLLSLGASVAAFIGPASAGFAIDGLGYRSAFLAVGLIAIVAAVLIFSLRGSLASLHLSKPTDETPKRTLDLLASPELRRTMLLSAATLTGIELFTFYFPIYGRSINLSASTIGMILAAYAVSAFIVRAFLHRITARYREVSVLGVSLISAAVVYGAVPHIGSAVLLAVAAFLLGLGLGSAQPLTTVLTYNNAPPGRAGEALGLRLTVNKATQISVPLMFGALGAAAGVAPVFWATAVFLGVAGVLSLGRPVRSVAPPPERPAEEVAQ